MYGYGGVDIGCLAVVDVRRGNITVGSRLVSEAQSMSRTDFYDSFFLPFRMIPHAYYRKPCKCNSIYFLLLIAGTSQPPKCQMLNSHQER